MSGWIWGLVISLLGGGLSAWAFLAATRKALKLGAKHSSDQARVPAWLTGLVERIFFTLLVAFHVQGVPTAMIGWLAIKLASNWNHPSAPKGSTTRAHAFLALLAGLISLGFSYVGGLVCGGDIRVGT
jgi:hypothetical protein